MRIGVDVGGTFTDAVCVTDGGEIATAKVPSVPSAPRARMVTAIDRALEQIGGSYGEVRRLIHGTTVATNALIEQRGAKLGILMTAGFEDTLELGRYKRSELYNIWADTEAPVFLCPRRRRRGILERTDHDGQVIEPLDESAVKAAVATLVEEQEVEAIAVCYLFSFVNRAHEVRTRELIAEQFPDLPVTISCEVSPEIREYERLCVTAFDAYIRTVVVTYLTVLSDELRELGIRAPLQLMESRGGVADARITMRRPATTMMSGPAAGVMGALHVGGAVGCTDIISIDIGGTSSDVSLVSGGRPARSREGSILTYPVRVPMIEMNSIGAGGGSIASVDAVGNIRVGPQSAGAQPGPACYGRGGSEATVTDASVVLEYIDPDYFAGATIPLNRQLAEEAVGRIADRLGVSLHEAAWGIHRVINANMTDQIRLISVGRGHDPRRFALVVLGGGGGLHGCAVAEGLGITKVIVPNTPGVLSAFGLLVSDVEHEQAQTFHVPLDALDEDAGVRGELEDLLARLDADGVEVMRDQGIAAEEVSVEYALDTRYVGQSYELEVPLPVPLESSTSALLRERFEARHRAVYGHARADAPIEIMTVRAVHRHLVEPPGETSSEHQRAAGASPGVRARQVYFGASEPVSADVHARAELTPGLRVGGPAIIDQADTTIVVYPGWTATVAEEGNLVLDRA